MVDVNGIHYQIGVVSFGIDCGGDYPGVYARYVHNFFSLSHLVCNFLTFFISAGRERSCGLVL